MPALSHESLSQVSGKGESRKGQSKGKKQSKEQGQGKGKTQSQWQQGEEAEPPPIKSMTLKELARLAQVGYEFEEFKRAKRPMCLEVHLHQRRAQRRATTTLSDLCHLQHTLLPQLVHLGHLQDTLLPKLVRAKSQGES